MGVHSLLIVSSEMAWGSSFLLFVSESLVSLFDEGELNTLLGEEGDEGLLALADHEHVVHSGGEVVASRVLDVSNIEAGGVLLDVLEHTDSSDVVASDQEHLHAVLELNKALNFASLKVQLYNN